MKINKKFEVETKAAQTSAVAVRETADQRKAKEISSQYGVLRCKASDFIKEAIKFGALLIEWEQFLGKSKGGYESAGEGLKGWLEKNCPEINYSTALKYKLYAEKNVQLLGGGAMALAALQGEASVTQPDGEVIDVEGEVIEKRDEIFAEANSFAKIEQMWLDLFGDGAQQGGKKKRKPRKVVAVAEGEGLSMSDSATVMWADAMRTFEMNRAAFHSAARDLKPMVARKFLSELKMLVDALEKSIDGED